MSIESAISDMAAEAYANNDTTFTPPELKENVRETKQQVWERTTRTAPPITKEDLRGEPKPDEETLLPDRALVAPEIAQYLQSKKVPEPNPTLSEVEKLRARIEELAGPEPQQVTETQLLLDKITALETRDLAREQEAREKAESEAEEDRMRTWREGVVSNLRAESNKYPGLIALSLEDNVFYTLFNSLESGKELSEDTVASEAEQDVWKVYDTLHAIKTKVSNDNTPSEAKKIPNTLTPNLVGTDEAWSLQDVLKTKDKRSAQAELWNRINNKSQ